MIADAKKKISIVTLHFGVLHNGFVGLAEAAKSFRRVLRLHNIIDVGLTEVAIFVLSFSPQHLPTIIPVPGFVHVVNNCLNVRIAYLTDNIVLKRLLRSGHRGGGLRGSDEIHEVVPHFAHGVRTANQQWSSR